MRTTNHPVDGGNGLGRLFSPASVVVVGATDRPGSYGAQTLLNLRRAGYPGRVVGVHPTRPQVLGAPCFATLAAAGAHLGGAPDAVVVAVPAAAATGYVAEAAALGCGGAVVYAAGFGETGRLAEQAGLVTAAAGLPVIGPNGNGLVSVAARAPLWGDATTLPADAGGIALITQSGNLGVLALAHRGGLGLHTVVSLGNAAVLDAPAVLQHLATTDGVRSVALYLEADSDGARLAAALSSCAEHDVRVVALKAGRSAEGRAAAGAHTAALAGDHRVFAALIEEAGGVLATDLHDLVETARALAGGRRDARHLAVLTASGGDAAIAADLAADARVPLAVLGEGTSSRIEAVIPGVAVTNPLDHTNSVWADRAAVAAITRALAGDPAVGPMIYVQDEPPGLPPVDADEWAATREGVLGAAEVTLVATTPGQEPTTAVSGLRPALRAISALRRPQPTRDRLDEIAKAAARRPGTGGRWLAEHEAKAALTEAGVEVPAFRTMPLTSPSPVIMHACTGLGLPVALKVSAPGLLHKSDAGLLGLNLTTEAEVTATADRLARAGAEIPDAVLLVEKMAPPGIELVLAAHRDGVVPALVVGLGGIWAEVLDDVVVVPLPASRDRVVTALKHLRAAAILTGARGRPGIDLEAVGELGSRLGDLLLAGFSLLELNPVIASPTGAVAVDALARR